MKASRLPGVADTLQIVANHVRTSQIVRLPVPADREGIVKLRLSELDADSLVERYTYFLERWTHHLIRVARRSEGLTLSLTPHGPSLLRLRLQERSPSGAALVVARLTITGGLAVGPTIRQGALVLRLGVRSDEHAGAVLTAEVLVENYAPLLLALPLPGGLRCRLYRASQARIHRAVTSAFLQAIVDRTMA